MTVNLSCFAGAGWQFFTDNGTPLTGGLIYTYSAGTTTPLATYTSSSGSTPHTNPIVLDAAGRPPSEIWLTNGSIYKFVLKDSTAVLIGTYDNIPGMNDISDLANTTSNAKGDALVGFKQSNSSGFLTGAVASTVNSKLQEFVSVRDFGAVGDGATDDTTAVQAALNLGAYHAIYFPTGTYICGPLTCGADITLYGDGPTNSQLKFKTGSSGALLTANNAVHFTLKDLGFSGNYVNCPSNTNCVQITGAESGGNGFWIDNCGFFLAKSIGLYQTGTYSKARISNCVVEGNQLDGIATNATNIIIEGNRCVLNGRFGILSQGSWAQIFGNTCTNNGQLVTGGAGIGVVNCSYAIVANNNCISNGTGAYFTHGIQFNTVANGVMDGNFSQGNNGSGLDIFTSAYTTCTGNQTLNNKVRGIEDDTTSTYSVIDGNVVIGNQEIGISVYNTIGSVISNNTVIGNGTLGTATNPLTGTANQPYGVALWGASSYGNYTTITGNSISGNVGSGANGVGLWVDPSCVSVSLLGNSILANTTATSSVKANFTFVRDNQGVYTQQTGSTTLAAGSTSVAVTFSPALTYAPTVSNIVTTFTAAPTTNTGATFITSVSASGFTFNTYTAPGGSGVGVAWSVSAFA